MNWILPIQPIVVDTGLSEGILLSNNRIFPTAITFDGEKHVHEAQIFGMGLRTELLTKGVTFYLGIQTKDDQSVVYIVPSDFFE